MVGTVRPSFRKTHEEAGAFHDDFRATLLEDGRIAGCLVVFQESVRDVRGNVDLPFAEIGANGCAGYGIRDVIFRTGLFSFLLAFPSIESTLLAELSGLLFRPGQTFDPILEEPPRDSRFG